MHSFVHSRTIYIKICVTSLGRFIISIQFVEKMCCCYGNRFSLTLRILYFYVLPSLSQVVIFQRHLRVEFTFHSRYSTACVQYSDFLDRAQLLKQTILKQDYVAPRLKSSLQQFYGRIQELVDRCGISISQMTISISQMTMDIFPFT